MNVYTNVATKAIRFPIIKVISTPITNIIPATNAGHFKIFCNAMENMITANGIAKNMSKIVFIDFSPFSFYYILCIIHLVCSYNN